MKLKPSHQMPKTKNIAILGCGWLGFPLAKQLIKKGFAINGSTTSDSKLGTMSEAGISPFLINLNEHTIDGEFASFLKNVETLVVAFPPNLRKNPNANFVAKVNTLAEALKKSTVKNIIYVSSTSVFEDREEGESGFRVITEETIPDGNTSNAKQLIEAENLLKNATEFDATILRFGGLLGGNRHPVKFLSGKSNIKNGDAPVNLIHLNDCIAIIELILEKNVFGTTFHGVNPIHQSKKEYYAFKAEALDLPKPEFEEDTISKGKVVHSMRLNTELGFEFSEEI